MASSSNEGLVTGRSFEPIDEVAQGKTVEKLHDDVQLFIVEIALVIPHNVPVVTYFEVFDFLHALWIQEATFLQLDVIDDLDSYFFICIPPPSMQDNAKSSATGRKVCSTKGLR